MTDRRFDDYLPRVKANELKSMARLWGGHTRLRKDESIATIREGLNDPERVRAAIAQLDPLEQFTLALLKQAGGALAYRALIMALHTSGWEIRRSGRRRYSDEDVIRKLARRGLFLTTYRSDPASVYAHTGENILAFSDPRLLAQAGPPRYRPFKIEPTATPPAVAYRSPPAVVLDLIGVLHAIEQVGGLGVTQEGTVRVGDVRKVVRAMEKGRGSSGSDAFLLADPAPALVRALLRSGLMSFKGEMWTLNTSPEAYSERSYAEQVRPVLYGFVGAADWSEWDALPSYEMYGLPQARGALLSALAALPVDGDGFYAIEDLGWALFERIGAYFSFDYLPHAPFYYRQTAEQYRQEEGAWQDKLRRGWQESEQQWISIALATWLTYLGVVELGLDGRAPVSVRLTALGRAVLHPELETALEAQPDAQGAAWVIQPNFEVVVYLDRTRPEQLAFLERHADRVRAQQHTAHYRLTRDAVYRGLESGTSLGKLLDRLRQGTDRALPQNIEVEIREWAALREQIALYRRARLLEFADAEARRAAVQAGASGVPVGDRYLRLEPGDRAPYRSTVDYARPLPRCASVSEGGEVRVSVPHPDLLIAAQLDLWAERVRRGVWQFSAPGVRAAVRGGQRIDELLDLLDARSRKPIPRLLRVALQAWAGGRTAVHVETVTVLKCPTPEVYEAVKASTMLKPTLRGVLAPNLLLVDTDQVDAFKAGMAWAGVEVVDGLPVERGRPG